MHISDREAGLQNCLFLLPFQNDNSVEPPIKAQDGIVSKVAGWQDQNHILKEATCLLTDGLNCGPFSSFTNTYTVQTHT